MSSWQRHKRNTPWLAGMIVLAAAYAAFLTLFHTFTGQLRWDGIIGMMVGLYICSHPAANVVDLIIFGRFTQRQGLSRRNFYLWWVLNLLVLLIGLVVVFSGTTRFTLH
jgi:amino acid transporter